MTPGPTCAPPAVGAAHAPGGRAAGARTPRGSPGSRRSSRRRRRPRARAAPSARPRCRASGACTRPRRGRATEARIGVRPASLPFAPARRHVARPRAAHAARGARSLRLIDWDVRSRGPEGSQRRGAPSSLVERQPPSRRRPPCHGGAAATLGPWTSVAPGASARCHRLHSRLPGDAARARARAGARLRARRAASSRPTGSPPGARCPGGIPYARRVRPVAPSRLRASGGSERPPASRRRSTAAPRGRWCSSPPGTFRINERLPAAHKGVTLRGDGPGRTVLQRTNGARPGVLPAAGRGSGRDRRAPALAASRRVTAPAPLVVRRRQGLATRSRSRARRSLASGQLVLLDEDHYATAGWRGCPPRRRADGRRIWATDRVVWQRHDPPAREDDPFPEAAGWFSRLGPAIARPRRSRRSTATSSPSRRRCTSRYRVVVRRAAHALHGPTAAVRQAGLEDLTVTGGGNGNVRFECGSHSWMRSVESTVWLGEGIAINNSFRIEVRDSYIHDAAWPYPGGGGYAISLLGRRRRGSDREQHRAGGQQDDGGPLGGSGHPSSATTTWTTARSRAIPSGWRSA